MFKITVTAEGIQNKPDLFLAAEEEITQFDQWFVSIGNEPMVRSERAILKTYLVARLAGLVLSDPAAAGTSTEDTLPTDLLAKQ